MMDFNVSSQLNINYSLNIIDNVFSLDSDLLLKGRNSTSKNCFVIVDKIVYELYYKKINQYFKAKTKSYKIHLVDGDENNKDFTQLEKIFYALNEYSINRRNEPIIIIGGGVVTDIAAFAASCYRRGMPHIKVPTTLMGYVDASVGIKNGINYWEYKNRIGSFYPPLAVLLDKTFFVSLSERDIANGIGEIIKIALIKNVKLFEALETMSTGLLETKFQIEDANFILKESIKDMIEELEPNLFEDNLERVVDFGHTFSLIFEMESNRDIKHGEAVAMDVLFSSYLSYKRKLISSGDLQRIIKLINAFNLPIHNDLFRADLLWKSLQERVYHRDGFQRAPVPIGIGMATFLNDITYEEISSVCEFIMKINYSDVVAA